MKELRSAALALTGCISTSPGIPNLYLLKLSAKSHSAHNATSAEIRFGYFGVCIGKIHGIQCQPTPSNISTLQNILGAQSPAASPLTKILPLVHSLQTKVFLPVLAVAGVLYFVGLIVFLKADDVIQLKSTKSKSADGAKSKGSKGENPKNVADKRRKWRHYTLIVLGSSMGFALASAVATNEAAGTARVLASSQVARGVTVEVGIALQAVQWLAFCFSFLVGWGMFSVLAYQAPSEDIEKGAASGLSTAPAALKAPAAAPASTSVLSGLGIGLPGKK